jgi:lysozyme
MKTSQEGIDLIKRWEGLSRERYLDVAGIPTIGYGHVIKEGEKLTKITGQKAEELLKADLSWAERSVREVVKVPLAQNQFDALVSFHFNTGAVQRSTLLRKLNEGRYAAVPAELMRWIHAGGRRIEGLYNRRKAEVEMWRGRGLA